MSAAHGEIVLLSSTSFQVKVGDVLVNAVIKGKRMKGGFSDALSDWERKKAFADNSLCVGDEVDLECEAGSWRITGRNDRRTSFVRYNFIKRKIQTIGANFDVLCIVVPHVSPAMNSFFVNTALTGLDGRCEVLFVFTKSDLSFSDDDRMVMDSVRAAGFDTVGLSSKSGENVSELQARIENKTALFVGESGGGKSTLLNRLFGKEVQAVGELSKKKSTGCHTTTSSVLICDGALRVIDTPGIRFVRPPVLSKTQIDSCFPELSDLGCKYGDCTHTGEAGCNADSAAESGAISALRLEDYRRMMSTDTFF